VPGKVLEAYIAELENQFNKENEKIEKRKKKFKKRFKIFSIIFILLFAVIFLVDLIKKDNLYNELKNAEITDAEAMAKIANSPEAIMHLDLYDKFEAAYLGNKSMNSMNYGLIAENQYGYTSINENNEVILHKNGKDTVISKEPISQINLAKDLVIFRGADKKLYACKDDGSDKKVIIDDKVGTVLLVGDDLYYVNYSKSNNLYKHNLKSAKSEVIIEEGVKNFTIAANTVLYINYDNKLSARTIGSTTYSWSDNNVEKFYFNGEVYVQNNDKIVKFNLNNHFPETIAIGISELLGVDKENVYYRIKNNVYSHNLTTAERKELSFNYNYYKGVYSVNNDIIALGGESSEN